MNQKTLTTEEVRASLDSPYISLPMLTYIERCVLPLAEERDALAEERDALAEERDTLAAEIAKLRAWAEEAAKKDGIV